MEESELREFMHPLSGLIQDFAKVIQVDVGTILDFQAILVKASEEIVQLTLSVNRDQIRVQQENQKAESEAKRWREEAVFDPLTRVFNRRFLLDRLQERVKINSPEKGNLGILFLDLDGFKPLNDTFGHRFGDQVLVEVANLLRNTVRPGDVVTRFGGDEFCILFETIDEAAMRDLSQQIWQAINQHTVEFENQKGKVGVSIGGILFDPTQQSHSSEQLLEAADKAMYHVKKGGKNRVHFLSLSMEHGVA